MNIVFISHPDFFTSYSMPRFAKMLSQDMQQRGHDVQVWSPQVWISNLTSIKSLRKWLIYIDQYIIFRLKLRKRILRTPDNTLFVVTDQALGLWIPAVTHRPHLIHCHDFLAQRCALGEIPGVKLSWTGQKYQSLIRQGFQKGKNFISVSYKTQQELHRFLPEKPFFSEVIYNGLNQSFKPGNVQESRDIISRLIDLNVTNGYLLNVGGNQWYKNRSGVIDIYDALRKNGDSKLHLIMIGQPPQATLIDRYNQSPYKNDIHLLTEIDDETVRHAYIGAAVFLFPSFAEGFGWPIIEAMASECPVITTNEAPMTEVAGDAAFLIPKRPYESQQEADLWAINAAVLVRKIINFSPEEKKNVIDAGLVNARRFDLRISLDNIENVYKKVLQMESDEKMSF